MFKLKLTSIQVKALLITPLFFSKVTDESDEELDKALRHSTYWSDNR